MAIWNNNTCNSHREFYNKYGTTQLNAQGVHNLSYFDQFILQNGVTLANSLFQFIGQNVDFSGSSSSAGSSGVAEVIREEHIDVIFAKYEDYGVSTIDDLEALVIEKDSLTTELNKNNNKIQELNSANNLLTAKNTRLANLVSSNQAEIGKLEDQIESLQGQEEMAQLPLIEKKIHQLKSEIKEYEKDIKENNKKIAENNNEIKKLTNENKEKQAKINKLANLEDDIDNLKVYMKHLKKAEGRDAIEELVNEDTGNITDLIDKYNRNPDDEKLKEKLEVALKEYIDNTENPSPTIVKYAEFKFGIKKTNN